MAQQMFVYILRSLALTAREDNVAKLTALFNKNAKVQANVNVTLVTSQEPAQMNADLIKAIVNIEKSDAVPLPFQTLLKPMHVNQLSNNLKHFTALRMIVENTVKTTNTSAASSRELGGATPIHVILEDDVLFNDAAVDMLLATLEAAPADYDMIFLGLPSTKNSAPDGAVSFEKVDGVFKVLPCCDSYVVSAKAAEKLVAAYLPVRFPTQIQLSYAMSCTNMVAYMCSPNVFIDGSKLGVYMSSIEQNNQLIWNPQYNQIRALLAPKDKTPEKAREDLLSVDALLSKAHFKEHPDFRYLSATAHVLSGRYEDARKDFDRAFEVYVAEKCVFGPDCQFMKDYVDVYRHLQVDFA